jgi:Uma2 family endonuclease
MADAPAISTGVMTLDEFIRRYDQEGPFEIIDGEVIPKIPNVAIHIETAKKLYSRLLLCEQQGLGEVFNEAPFVLTDRPNWVKGSRVPDIMFFSAGRLTQYRTETENWQRKPYILVPDLIIEVVSPNDSYSDIGRRIVHYFDDGVRMVWVVDPQLKQVIVHVWDSDQQTKLRSDATLTGGDVLPGFQLKLSDLFSA